MSRTGRKEEQELVFDSLFKSHSMFGLKAIKQEEESHETFRGRKCTFVQERERERERNRFTIEYK
jgi:hypothetical protein